mmetsp:Transcript_47938/g.116594  ORF Transcript_47938/g.116594 Transcript_47938/m.116594 type:complete len:458 (+) Transcript_47938:51-1424(+)
MMQMPSSLPRNRLLFLAATVLTYNLRLPSSAAFSFSTIKPPSDCARNSLSTVVLHAKKKKKKRNSSDKGFGNAQNRKQEPVVESEAATTSADVVARLNALYTLEADTEDDEKDQSEVDSSEISESDLSIESEVETSKVEYDASTDERSHTGEQSDHSHSDEVSLLLAQRYREEFEYQQYMAQNQTHMHQLVQLSSSPLIFTIDEFIDPETCRRVQNDATGCFDLMYPEQLSDKLFNGQESEMDGLLFNLASSQEHTTDDPYPDGLHMDTNNRCLNRHVTCILYLNDIPEECGGATVFPLARTMSDDPVLQASQRLLNAKISHTRQQLPTEELKSDARLLESRLPVQDDFLETPDTSTVIRIQPKAGKLLVFFSRDENGQDDARTWHAGERIKPNDHNQMTEKRILTLFKEVFYEDDNNVKTTETPLEEYLAPMVEEQRIWLKAKAKLQRALLEQSSS